MIYNDENDQEFHELIAWERQVKRYLAHDVLGLIAHAKEELERLDFLWGRIRMTKSVSTPIMKADISIEGHLVVGCSLDIRISKYSRSNPVIAKLQQYRVLDQILQFHGIIKDQLQVLHELEEWLANSYTDRHENAQKIESESSSVHLESIDRAYKKVSELCRRLRDAGNSLRLPSSRRFPYTSHADLRFVPALPPDVIASISIHRGELLVEAFYVAEPSKPTTDIPIGCVNKLEFVGNVCQYWEQSVEIIDYASVSIPIPQLEEILGHLDSQIKYFSYVRNNLQALAVA